VQKSRWITINPLYASQSDIEKDIIEVVFDGLFRYNREGNLVPNLAKSFETEDDRVFDVTLREDLYWSDGEEMTAEDIVFTVETILNPDFQSTLRQQWTGVSAEKLSEREVRFTLDSTSAVFPENLTLKIIPKHIFGDYSPRDFRYSIHNMQPVGSGPYRYKEAREDSEGNIYSLRLERNPHYFRSTPFMDEVSFYFFEDEEELLRAYEKREIDGFSLPGGRVKELFKEHENAFHYHEYRVPRYFSLLFNLRREGLVQEDLLREALSYATNREALVSNVLKGKGDTVTSPLLPSFYGLTEPETSYSHNPEKAKELLEEAGFKDGIREMEDPFRFSEDLREDSQGEEVRKLQECFLYLQEQDKDLYPGGEVTGFFDEDTKEAVNHFQEKYREEILDPHDFQSGTGMVAGSTRDKLNELCEDLFEETTSLEISITTLEDSLLVATAKELQEQWEKVGVSVTIDKRPLPDIRDKAIRLRDFDTLLFGTVLTGSLNPFPLWHSSKVDDPGINLPGYESEEADELLESIIEETGENRTEALHLLQEKILEDLPGIFLYSPYYIHPVSERIKGVKEGSLMDPSERFADIDKWYINTRRVFK